MKRNETRVLNPVKMLLFAWILGAVAAGSTAAGDLETVLSRLVPGLSAADIEEIQTHDYIRFHAEDEPLEFRFLPRTSISGNVADAFDHVDPNVVTEVLYVLPRPQRADGTQFQSNEDLLLYVYNTLRAVSRLSGVTYESNRAGGERVLFDDVYRIETLRRREPLPDPVVDTIPREDSFLLHLEDSNFGTSYFEATYIGGRDAVSMGMTNARSLSFVVPVIRAERVRFQLMAVPAEDFLLLYGAVGLEAGGFLRRVVHLPSSFRRRIEALADWFIGEVY